jgi:hypothetical protein
MKKVIFAAMMALSCTFAFAGNSYNYSWASIGHTPSSIKLSEPNGTTVTVHLELGRKKHDCTGFGICASVDITLELSSVVSSGGNAEITINQDGSLQVNFKKSSMTAETIKKYFSQQYFIVEEDFALSTSICSALGTKSYTIKTGKYPVKSTETHYSVKFTAPTATSIAPAATSIAPADK